MQEYTVEIGGIEHTIQLTDEDAKARGLTAKSKAADAPKNKAATASKSKG